jgi:hypothetical protein
VSLDAERDNLSSAYDKLYLTKLYVYSSRGGRSKKLSISREKSGKENIQILRLAVGSVWVKLSNP